MANINKNELYNLICEYYENNDALQENGYSMREWANLLGVSIAPATITALVREGLLVVDGSRRTVKHYRKVYTIEGRDRRKVCLLGGKQ